VIPGSYASPEAIPTLHFAASLAQEPTLSASAKLTRLPLVPVNSVSAAARCSMSMASCRVIFALGSKRFLSFPLVNRYCTAVATAPVYYAVVGISEKVLVPSAGRPRARTRMTANSALVMLAFPSKTDALRPAMILRLPISLTAASYHLPLASAKVTLF